MLYCSNLKIVLREFCIFKYNIVAAAVVCLPQPAAALPFIVYYAVSEQLMLVIIYYVS